MTDPVRHGAPWSGAADAELIREARGVRSLADIAAASGRTPNAVRMRLARLLGASSQEAQPADVEAAFESLRRRVPGGSAPDDAGGVQRTAHVGHGASAAPPEGPADDVGSGISAARYDRRRKALRVAGELLGRSSGAPSRWDEIEALGAHDEATIRDAGRRLLDSTGRLELDAWLCESEWPGAHSVQLDRERVRRGDEEVSTAVAELVTIASQAIAKPRDRDILLARLGLIGEATVLAAIGGEHGITRERVRQIVKKGVTRLRRATGSGPARGWHHVARRLAAALTGADGSLDPSSVLTVIEHALPAAPTTDATALLAALCGRPDTPLLREAITAESDRRSRERQEQLRAEREYGRLNGRLMAMVENADWPSEVEVDSRWRLHPQRNPRDPDDISRAGYWDSPMLGRPVGYDSRVELDIIQMVELSDLVASYCEQPVVIPYELAGRSRRYFPDLGIDLRDGRRLIVEVKGSMTDFATTECRAKAAAAREWCHAHGWGFVSVTGRGKANDLGSRPVDPGVESAIAARLAEGGLGWMAFKILMQQHRFVMGDAAACIYRNGWYWQPRPFVLSLQPP